MRTRVYGPKMNCSIVNRTKETVARNCNYVERIRHQCKLKPSLHGPELIAFYLYIDIKLMLNITPSLGALSAYHNHVNKGNGL